MLSKELLAALNEQMNQEYFAAHAYMAMAAYCDKESYDGFANFIQNKLKRNVSTVKIYDYINDRGEHAIFDTIKAPKVEFSSILETFKDSLAQERDVTQRFYNLSELARNDKDYATISF